MSATVKQYAYHYQDVWQERATDERIELVWRLAALAYGYHRRNGHATFEAGQIAAVLGISPSQVSNVLTKAKELGLIDQRSRSRCLVVPPHAINYGPGDANEPCAYCEGKRATRRKPRNAAVKTNTNVTPERPAEANADAIVLPFRPVAARELVTA